MPTKVLLIITKLELGGAQKNVLDILANLDRREFEPYLLASDGLLGKEARDICGNRFFVASYLRRSPNLLFDLLAVFFIASFIRRHKISVVHTHSSKAGILGRWAAKLAGVNTVIHTVHGWSFHGHFNGWLNRLYVAVERITACITTKLVAVCDCDIQKGLSCGIGNSEQYVKIRCATEVLAAKEPSLYLSLKYSLGLTQDDIVVGMVACLKPQKNPVDFVIAASNIVQSNPFIKFLLIGDGILKKQVDCEIEKRGLQDNFLALGWRKDACDIIPFLDVFVLTSLWEGLPLVLLEAMHFAKPIVAYDVCGVGEVVKDGVNGFLVRPKDVEDLSSKIELLLNDEALRRRMGSLGKYMASDDINSIPVMMRQITKLYRNE